MAYKTCENCGTKLSGGNCPNCQEEIFIAQQYRDLGEPVPEIIAVKELKQLSIKQNL